MEEAAPTRWNGAVGATLLALPRQILVLTHRCYAAPPKLCSLRSGAAAVAQVSAEPDEKQIGRVAPSRHPSYRAFLMQQAQPLTKPTSTSATIPDSLRHEMEKRRSSGHAFNLKE